jgi:hypothetical protein
LCAKDTHHITSYSLFDEAQLLSLEHKLVIMMDSSVNEVNNGAVTSNTAKSCVLVAKWGRKRIILDDMTVHDTIANVKDRLTKETGVLQKRQKLIGLVAVNGGSKAVNDDTILGDLKVSAAKKVANSGYDSTMIVHEFILMGTAEADIFVDPSEKDDLPDVIDDFDLAFHVRMNRGVGTNCTNGFPDCSVLAQMSLSSVATHRPVAVNG